MPSTVPAQAKSPHRPDPELSLDWPAWLAAATRVLVSSLDYETTLATVAELAVPALADGCLVDLLQPDGSVRRVAVARAEPEGEALARALPCELRPPTDAVGVGRVLRTGEPEGGALSDAVLQAVALDDAHLAQLRQLAAHTYLCVPLRARDRLLGTLTFVAARSELAYGERELLRAVDLAERAAMAIDNARLHEAAQRARARAERMQELTAALSAAASQRAVGEIALRHGVSTVGSYAGVVALLSSDRDALEILSSTGYAHGCMLAGQRWPLSSAIPIADATRSGVPVFVASPQEWAERYGGGAAPAASRSAAWAAIPLALQPATQARGALLWTFDQPRAFLPDEREHLLALARLCAQALERARLHEAEAAARRTAERAAERLARLNEVTARLAKTLTREEVAAVVTDHAAVGLGARAGSVAVLSADGQGLELLTTFGYAPEVVERYRRMSIDEPFPLADAIRSAEPVVLHDAAERDARYPHLAELRRSNGDGPMAALPLSVRGRVVGALGLNFPDGRELEADDRSFLVTLSQQCAQALERAGLYEAERSARAEAEAANRAKADFLATMSHELRTPLNAIAGYTQLLQMGVRGELNDAQRSYLERIQRSQHHLLSLINDVLNFAKLEAGKLDILPRRVLLSELLGDLEALVRPQLQLRQLRYEASESGPESAVWADPEKVRQILLNLVGNAIKFTPPGGSIHVECDQEAEAVRVRVHDSGVGIPADKLDSIFEPFVQLERSLTSHQEGTGLGLAISRDLARAMGGELSAASEIGKGSVFTLRLPRERE